MTAHSLKKGGRRRNGEQLWDMRGKTMRWNRGAAAQEGKGRRGSEPKGRGEVLEMQLATMGAARHRPRGGKLQTRGHGSVFYVSAELKMMVGRRERE